MDLKIVSLEGKRDETGRFVTNRQYSERSWTGRWVNTAHKDSPSGNTRVSVAIEGEGFWDNLANRTTRPHTLWAPLVRRALIEAGWPKDVKIRWSQKAGCSCPCSPAFYVYGGTKGLDLWLTLAVDEPQTTDPEIAAARLNQVLADPTLAALAKA